MSDLREAAKLALIALENGTSPNLWLSTKENLRQALAQPEQEPVAWMMEVPDKNADRSVKMTSCEWVAKEWENPISLYTAPQKREWVGLTDEEIEQCFVFDWSGEFYANWRKQTYEAIKAKLKEKNT